MKDRTALKLLPGQWIEPSGGKKRDSLLEGVLYVLNAGRGYSDLATQVEAWEGVLPLTRGFLHAAEERLRTEISARQRLLDALKKRSRGDRHDYSNRTSS